MNRRSQVGLHFACTNPDKHPTTLAPPLLTAMPFRPSENRHGQDSCQETIELGKRSAAQLSTRLILMRLNGGADETRTRDLRRDRPAF